MASPRASRILGAIAAHPSSSSAGVDGGLWFGGKLLPGLPLPLGAPVRSIALPKLAHSQLSVRENAIRLYATYLSRSPVSEVVSCLDDILDILALKVSLVDYGPKLESTEEEGSARVPLNGLLPAFSAEGVLGLLAIVVRLVGPAALHAEWAVIFQSVFKYLGHPASTVRQITSKVFLEVMISTKVDQSEVAVSLVCLSPCFVSATVVRFMLFV